MSTYTPPCDTPHQELAEFLPDGVLMLQDGVVVYANPAAARLLKANSTAALEGHSLAQILPATTHTLVEDLLASHEENPDTPPVPAEMVIPCSAQEGAECLVEVAAAHVTHAGRPATVTVWRDIAHRSGATSGQQRLAQLDSLTGLPNRALFMDRLEQEVARAWRSNRHVALMFIDLDRFKWVNDTLGHGAGDELLKETAVRLRHCLRRSDTVARLGGDEFTVILPDMSHGPLAERAASKILDSLASPYFLEGQEVFISGSVGITVYPDDATTPQDMMKNADSAMYRAKHSGRNAYRFFTPDMHTEAMERMQLEGELRHVLTRNQLAVHYQPIVDMEDLRLLGAECYLRWHHPERGDIPPNRFVRLAEEIGMIGALTEWTLRTACRQAAAWRKMPGWEEFFVSVNLSCTRCRELSTDDKIPGILRETGLPPQALTLEITETILGEDEPKALAMLHHLKRMGVRLWLDDFGTGQSSLGILRKLPVHAIKIDNSFIRDIPQVPESTLLVHGLLSLAKQLNLTVVGEGVEIPAQRQFLFQLGCHLGQGYLFSRPLSGEAFTRFLAEGGRVAGG